MRAAIGRGVNFVTKVKTDCPVCDIDPFTGNSTDPFCTTCSGIGYTIVPSGTVISGHITWNPSEALYWQTAGQLQQYSCRVQIEHTAENVYVVDHCDYVEVDSKQLRVAQKTYRGVQSLNRIIIDLKEI